MLATEHLVALPKEFIDRGLGTRELCADGAGAAVALVLDGDEAELIEAPEATELVTIDSTRRYATIAGSGPPGKAAWMRS